jgi:hypothetical protein
VKNNPALFEEKTVENTATPDSKEPVKIEIQNIYRKDFKEFMKMMEHFQLLLLQKALSPFFVVLFEMVKDVVYLLLYHPQLSPR